MSSSFSFPRQVESTSGFGDYYRSCQWAWMEIKYRLRITLGIASSKRVLNKANSAIISANRSSAFNALSDALQHKKTLLATGHHLHVKKWSLTFHRLHIPCLLVGFRLQEFYLAVQKWNSITRYAILFTGSKQTWGARRLWNAMTLLIDYRVNRSKLTSTDTIVSMMGEGGVLL